MAQIRSTSDMSSLAKSLGEIVRQLRQLDADQLRLEFAGFDLQDIQNLLHDYQQ